MNDLSFWGQLIGQVGFPIAIAVYVLVRLNGKLEKLTRALERNTRVMLLVAKESGSLSDEIRELLE